MRGAGKFPQAGRYFQLAGPFFKTQASRFRQQSNKSVPYRRTAPLARADDSLSGPPSPYPPLFFRKMPTPIEHSFNFN